MKKKVALSIAGFDPSGGAGIQTDLKTFSSLGVHGITVVTCITVQNTQRVEKIHKPPIDIIEDQVSVLTEEFKIDAVKTGMLYDSEIVSCISKKISQYNMKCVVDPVMIATSGNMLSEGNFVDAIKKELVPKAFIITPNIPEACMLTRGKIETIDEMKKACKKIYEMGSKYVLIKGGHLDNTHAHDVLFDGGKYTVLSLPKIPDKKAHGSGCTLSALITGLLVLGETPDFAIRKAKHILWNMIEQGYIPGLGSYVLNHSSNIVLEMPYSFPTNDHFISWRDLKKSVDNLLSFLPKKFIPEVGINIGYALPNAKTLEQVCSINGRITKTKDKPRMYGGLAFGASRHIASIILAAMAFDLDVRCAMNVRFFEESLEKCKKADFSIGSFDRSNEPAKKISTMEWGTKETISHLDYIPDIIYDTGGMGKEPMIRILGKNPKEVVDKIYVLSKDYES
jgi:hydroxymethylpyrimidine/phosphomethylpyrimidine kinase